MAIWKLYFHLMMRTLEGEEHSAEVMECPPWLQPRGRKASDSLLHQMNCWGWPRLSPFISAVTPLNHIKRRFGCVVEISAYICLYRSNEVQCSRRQGAAADAVQAKSVKDDPRSLFFIHTPGLEVRLWTMFWETFTACLGWCDVETPFCNHCTVRRNTAEHSLFNEYTRIKPKQKRSSCKQNDYRFLQSQKDAVDAGKKKKNICYKSFCLTSVWRCCATY